MNISAEVQRDIDLKVDNLLQQMYRTADRLVIDSRMAWHWMPESFKVFLVLDRRRRRSAFLRICKTPGD